MPTAVDGKSRTVDEDDRRIHCSVIDRNRHTAALAALIVASSAAAGVLSTTDPEARIDLAAPPTPPILASASHEFSLIGWVRQQGRGAGPVRSVIDGNGVLRVAVDDLAGGLRFSMIGEEAEAVALVPLQQDGLVPSEQWMLLACVWDPAEGRLTAWARSEQVPWQSETAVAPDWTGPAPWPPTLGSNGEHPSFAGQFGLTVIRGGVIGEDDLQALWMEGAPHYFGPALRNRGGMDGLGGVQWMIGHGVITQPDRSFNDQAAGAELGDRVTPDNLLVYVAAASGALDERSVGAYYSAGAIEAVSGEWTLESPHANQEHWGGFFQRQLPRLGVNGPRTVSRFSPRARLLAEDRPEGLLRIVASANSRGVRTVSSYGLQENWAYGGLLAARRSSVAGVGIPAWSPGGDWPGFDGTARVDGVALLSSQTPFASVAFGSFGSHGLDNPNFPGYSLIGNTIVIHDGSSYIPKARPEPGTRFAESTQPLTVRALVLRFPGSGAVTYRGQKAPGQQSALFTESGKPMTETLDSTRAVHALTDADVIYTDLRTVVLSGVIRGIEPGDGCFIAEGAGLGGISVVEEVLIFGGSWTVVTLERWFPSDPQTGTSVLRFGPIEPLWLEHAWDGLAPDDPEIYRGIRLTAEDGPVTVLYLECFNPAVDGFIVSGVGRSGRGYASQLEGLLHGPAVPLFTALQPDVWLQFFAHQQSEPQSMSLYRQAIADASPNTEIWWCGDPDLDTAGEKTSVMDQWQSYILEHAMVEGVGAVVAHEHPAIGTGNERAADGQVADRGHLSGRGCQVYVQAVLEMLEAAALTTAPPAGIRGDVDGDGRAGIDDLLAVLAALGAGPATSSRADLDGDGWVDAADIRIVAADLR
jgi:hypothetical protein